MLTSAPETSLDTSRLETHGPAAVAPDLTSATPVDNASAMPPVREPAINSMFRRMFEMKASDLHLSATMAPMVRKDGEMRRLHDGGRARCRPTSSCSCWRRSCRRSTARSSRRGTTPTSPTKSPGLARFRANVFRDRHGAGAVFRVIPADILTAEQLGLSPHVLGALPAEKGPGARHRSDRVGQVDDALRDDRPHQQDPRRPHHHHRRSDRVRAPQPEVPDQPARGAHAHALVQGRAARGAARGSGRHPGRRAARPRDDRDRDRDRGDRPPGVRHAAHERRRRRRSTASSISSRPIARRRFA